MGHNGEDTRCPHWLKTPAPQPSSNPGVALSCHWRISPVQGMPSEAPKVKLWFLNTLGICTADHDSCCSLLWKAFSYLVWLELLKMSWLLFMLTLKLLPLTRRDGGFVLFGTQCVWQPVQMLPPTASFSRGSPFLTHLTLQRWHWTTTQDVCPKLNRC
jgi:hypothetical protein